MEILQQNQVLTYIEVGALCFPQIREYYSLLISEHMHKNHAILIMC